MKHYDRLLSIEETIRNRLGDLGVVDGHDIGSSEMSVFVHTDEPKRAFDRAIKLLGSRRDLQELKAGDRDFDEDEYVAIYPKGLDSFSVAGKWFNSASENANRP